MNKEKRIEQIMDEIIQELSPGSTIDDCLYFTRKLIRQEAEKRYEREQVNEAIKAVKDALYERPRAFIDRIMERSSRKRKRDTDNGRNENT